jgi:Sigma-54 interaction domain
MNNPSKLHAGAVRIDGPGSGDGGSRSPDRRRLAEDVLGDLMAMGMPGVNLLLSGMDDVVQNILDTILSDLETPIGRWYPGERLVLPPVSRAGTTGTMILHDVGAMDREDQLRLLAWSELAAGKVRIVSTASTPLMPLVDAGTFNDRLYYRLNTVFVDVTS